MDLSLTELLHLDLVMRGKEQNLRTELEQEESIKSSTKVLIENKLTDLRATQELRMKLRTAIAERGVA